MRGEGEWQIQHKAKPGAYLPRDPTPSAVFSRTPRVYSAFTDLLVLRGRIISVFRGEELSV